MKNITQMIRNMKETMDQTKKELKNTKTEVSSKGKKIHATFNGNQELETLTIDPQLLNPNEKEELEQLLIKTINNGIEKSGKIAKKHMSLLTGGLKLPTSLKDLF